MDIWTNEFRHDPRQFRRVVVLTNFRRFWWYALLISLFGAFYLFASPYWFTKLFGLLFVGLGPGIIYLASWLRTRGRALEAQLSRLKRYRFTDNGFETHMDGELQSRFPYDLMEKAERRDGVFRLFIQKHFFVVLPETAFASPDEAEAAASVLRDKGLLRP